MATSLPTQGLKLKAGGGAAENLGVILVLLFKKYTYLEIITYFSSEVCQNLTSYSAKIVNFCQNFGIFPVFFLLFSCTY